MYKEDELKIYIKNSVLRKFSNTIKVRLSKELATKYDNGNYENYLTNMQNCLNQINSLNIKYPSNANPTLYVYIVPDENYAQLLRVPEAFDNGKGGGKPVKCYDLDGFHTAYGLSQNLLENYDIENQSISRLENEIHELSHIIHSEFFFGTNHFLCEGLAEALPLYILNYEDKFDEHRNLLKQLSEEEIYSAKELIDSEKDNTYGIKAALPNRSCSFRYSYISSYLFVRGCIETIEQLNNINKKEALQKFLESVKHSNCHNEWLIFDIANSIGMSPEYLLTTKDIQLNIIKNL